MASSSMMFIKALSMAEYPGPLAPGTPCHHVWDVTFHHKQGGLIVAAGAGFHDKAACRDHRLHA